MQTLDQKFTYDQFTFHQIARNGNVVMLGKNKENHSRLSFEVIIIQHHPAQTIHGREYPARESMPPSESWGISGWTFTTEEEARRKFQELAGQDLIARPEICNP